MVSTGHKDTARQFRGADLRIFVRDVRDRQAKKRPITVRSWSTIKDVKDVLSGLLHVPPHFQRLYFGPLLTAGKELPNYRTLHDAGIYRSGETLLLDIQGGNSGDGALWSMHSLRASNDVCISSCLLDACPKPLKHLVQQAKRGLALGLKPDCALDGSGGTYFLHDARKNPICVFKPADEEPYAEHNPRGYLPQPGQQLSLREGVKPGEACIREVAAFMLDHGGFAGVPMTTLAEARHPAFNTNGSHLSVSQGGACIGSHSISPRSPVKAPHAKKAGSLQEYIRCECTMDDISPSKISVKEVQKICILDIMLMNADRNSANLLVQRLPDDSLVLVPIDHGYCLRSKSDVSWMDWCWLDWPQLKEPVCDEFKKYIASRDIESDARLLRERLNICEQAIDIFRASTSLLKAGVKAGLTLYEIAVMCCRNDNLGEIPSKLERLSSMASELALIAVENEKYHHAAASRALVEQLTPKQAPRPSFLSRDRSSGYRMHKCASSGEFLSLSSGSQDSMNKREPQSPGMANSSASSDSSSASAASVDAGEVDREECEEWAALVIADVSLEKLPLPMAGRGRRTSSICSSDDGSSDSMLSSSPKGFWHVRPGASPLGSSPLGSSDGSVTWSPRGSPHGSPLELLADLPEPPFNDSSNDFKIGDAAMDDLKKMCEEISTTPTDQPILWGGKAPTQHSKRPSVTFAPVLPSDGVFVPPATVQVSEFKANASMPGFVQIERKNSGLTRSRSHPHFQRSFSMTSATSNTSSDGGGGVVALRSPKLYTEEHENYRKYYLNFIDLVVQRETTAAVHVAKGGTTTVA